MFFPGVYCLYTLLLITLFLFSFFYVSGDLSDIACIVPVARFLLVVSCSAIIWPADSVTVVSSLIFFVHVLPFTLLVYFVPLQSARNFFRSKLNQYRRTKIYSKITQECQNTIRTNLKQKEVIKPSSKNSTLGCGPW